MESQLAEYRALREKEREKEITSFRRFTNIFRRRNTNESSSSNQNQRLNVGSKPVVEARTLSQTAKSTFYGDGTPVESNTRKTYLLRVLKVVLWFVLWQYFISIGFGAVYFIVSCSYLMYINTATGPRTGLSAYSVFNPNHETLQGTFTAEQFEKELRHGATSVK